MAQLCQHQHAFRQRRARVAIVSFGTLPAVQQWLRETCADFDVLLDRQREVYRAYGLERSFWRSRNLRTLWLYLQRNLRGIHGGDSHGDDTTQLGGDFVIHSSGRVLLAYRSHDPTDRPAVETLLRALETQR